MGQRSSETLYRFGLFEVDKETGELRRQGRRMALQGQPLQVLVMLLERPGELVTRTDIQQRIWPDGTFVDFEHGLNSAVNKIRDALGDSAANPRFIETLAKRGYRFIASVENTNNVAPSQPGKEGHSDAKASQRISLRRQWLTSAADLPRVPRIVAQSLFFALQVMYLFFYIATLARLKDAQEVVNRIVPGHVWVVALLTITAATGIPIRLYLLSGLAFRSPTLRSNFLRLFPMIFPFDELWALAPFLLIGQIGFGLALGATAALLYAPFAQRSLILMSFLPQAFPPSAAT